MALQTATSALKESKNSLGIFVKVLDQSIPWSTFEETINELNKNKEQYSSESSALVKSIKEKMKNSMDSYHAATNSIYSWCKKTTNLLSSYIQMFNNFNGKSSSEEQKNLLIQVLDHGIKMMTEAQNQLESSASSFNEAAGQLTSLYSRLQGDSDRNSQHFQDLIKTRRLQIYGPLAFTGILGLGIGAAVVELKVIPDIRKEMEEVKSFFRSLKDKVTRALKDIDSTKTQLQNEIRVIGDLRVQTEATKSFVDLDGFESLRDTVIGAAKDLLNMCNDFIRTH